MTAEAETGGAMAARCVRSRQAQAAPNQTHALCALETHGSATPEHVPLVGGRLGLIHHLEARRCHQARQGLDMVGDSNVAGLQGGGEMGKQRRCAQTTRKNEGSRSCWQRRGRRENSLQWRSGCAALPMSAATAAYAP